MSGATNLKLIGAHFTHWVNSEASFFLLLTTCIYCLKTKMASSKSFTYFSFAENFVNVNIGTGNYFNFSRLSFLRTGTRF